MRRWVRVMVAGAGWPCVLAGVIMLKSDLTREAGASLFGVGLVLVLGAKYA